MSAYVPPALAAGRAWGFGLNLYALRSPRNWGVGDFTDLAAVVARAGALGADLVGVGPLHALHYLEPEAASPYSPTSRSFLNPIYLDVECVPEFRSDTPAAAALRDRVASPAFCALLAALRASAHVEYTRVARAKWSALEVCYDVLRAGGDPARTETFRAYVADGGERLERFAAHQALAERFAREPGGSRHWQQWPPAYRDAGSEEVRTWAARARKRVEYYKYLQWLAEDQLAAVARDASALAIGLYLDVAVGVAADAADVWADPGAYDLASHVGAPPDPLGPAGQDWGLPPPRPKAMLRDGGAGFSAMLAHNMAHAGALRLDHVMALRRLFTIPRGARASEGRYVDYPFEELLAVVSARSRDARCVVVGEDLGTVPEGFRPRLEREGLLSYRLLPFQRDAEGAFLPPDRYPVLALATASTHDLPTLAGWVLGRDVAIRERLGIFSADEAERARVERTRDVTALGDALVRAGVLAGAERDAAFETVAAVERDATAIAPLARATYGYLARSAAKLVVVALDDAVGEVEQINLPGTNAEYANWRRKQRATIDEIFDRPDIVALARDVSVAVRGQA